MSLPLCALVPARALAPAELFVQYEMKSASRPKDDVPHLPAPTSWGASFLLTGLCRAAAQVAFSVLPPDLAHPALLTDNFLPV